MRITTAYRSCMWLRKNGWNSAVVEHRFGSFVRKDLFGIADVIAFRPVDGIILVQAYDQYKKKEHVFLDMNNKMIREWVLSGGKFFHHVWKYTTKNKRKYWYVEIREVKYGS